MNSSKITEEYCSSNESGWTTYIASPEEHECGREEDEECSTDDDDKKDIKKQLEVEEDVESDDSMASDASSGPSDLHAGKKDVRKYGGKKHKQQEDKKQKNDDDELMKDVKDKSKKGPERSKR